MRHNDVIYLLSTDTTYDELGNPVESTVKRKVYANRMRVTANERYEAANQGLKPVKRFEIYSFEYEDEKELEHEGVVYQITLPDERGDKIQLVCEKDVGNE